MSFDKHEDEKRKSQRFEDFQCFWRHEDLLYQNVVVASLQFYSFFQSRAEIDVFERTIDQTISQTLKKWIVSLDAIRTCFAQCKISEELLARSFRSRSHYHFKKSWSRHRVECDELEVVRYNCRMNIKSTNNSTLHFNWMQKDENVCKKSSHFASLSKTL